MEFQSQSSLRGPHRVILRPRCKGPPQKSHRPKYRVIWCIYGNPMRSDQKMDSQSMDSWLNLSGDVLGHCWTRIVLEYSMEIDGNQTVRIGSVVEMVVIGWQWSDWERIGIQCRNVVPCRSCSHHDSSRPSLCLFHSVNWSPKPCCDRWTCFQFISKNPLIWAHSEIAWQFEIFKWKATRSTKQPYHFHKHKTGWLPPEKSDGIMVIHLHRPKATKQHAHSHANKWQNTLPTETQNKSHHILHT